MTTHLKPITLEPCIKGYTKDLDKAVAPEITLTKVKNKLANLNFDILAETKRVDVGRLGIPVYLSLCGSFAKKIMPTHKQMGKGSSAAQAEASAIMELVERYSYFSFWQREPNFTYLTYSEAKQKFAHAVIPIEEILLSVNEQLDLTQATTILDLLPWRFAPATDLAQEKIVWLPLDWFKLLNEFNGSSAGNTPTESILQGLAELVERHVCCLISANKIITPTISITNASDKTLIQLVQTFKNNGIELILKDFSLEMPLPTVGAIAFDPQTLHQSSEIVFTAGTATSPTKAAIRAITEIAQLGGDFCTHACYEASGLPKFKELAQISWLLEGEHKDINAIPKIEDQDIKTELTTAIKQLAPWHVYSIDITDPILDLAANYTLVPGLQFRERDRNPSLGLFTGRRLIEEGDLQSCQTGLQILQSIYGDSHFIPFFYGMLAIKQHDLPKAKTYFDKALPLQPNLDSQGLCHFYAGYVLHLQKDYQTSIDYFEQALNSCPEMKEAANFLGVAHFKLQNYPKAKEAFRQVLSIDKGSAVDLANLGLCEKFLGELAAAYEHLSAALSIDPNLEFAQTAVQELEDKVS